VERLEREHDDAVERLEASARADREQLAERLRQEHELALAKARGEARKRIDAVEAELAATREEIARLTEHTERDRAQLETLRHEYEQAADTLRRDHQRQVETLRREYEQAAETLRHEHQRTLLLNEQESRRLAEQLREQIEQARTQQLWLQEELERETARLQQKLEDEYQRGMAVGEQHVLPRLDALHLQLDAAGAEKRRIEQLLEQTAAAHARGMGELMAERANAERALTDAVGKKNQVLKAFADQGAEVRALQETVRTLSAVAAEGRLAREVAAEMQRVLIALDDRARYLLTLTSLDAVHRDEVEGVRKDILRAAVLAQQLGQPPSRPGPAV
jgi:hypothetical protein